jgi:hypothetical protein
MPKHTTHEQKTQRDPDERKQDWKRDRYAQRDAKVTARRNITGGF